MNRLNFLKYQSPTEGTAPAVSRTVSVSPIDIVGELRVTKFRLSRETLPIMMLYPSQRPFTQEEVNAVPINVTPSDIEVFSFSCKDYQEGDVIPHNGVSYCLRNTAVTSFYKNLPSSYRDWNIDFKKLLVIHHINFALQQPPIWEERSGSFYLKNEPVPIYSWDDLHDKTNTYVTSFYGGREITSLQYSFRVVDTESSKPDFHLRLNFYIDLPVVNDYNLSTPTLAFSTAALNFFGLNSSSLPLVSLQCPQEFLPLGRIEGSYILGYVPPMDYKWNQQLLSQISNWNTSIRIPLVDFDCYFHPLIQTLPEDFFPAAHILITTDELNFAGEKININTLAQQGVISPSSLTILKSFFIGINSSSSVASSDFIYLDDSLNNSPVIVNNPRQATLTIRLWFVTSSGYISPIMLNPGSGFSIQFSII